MGNHWNSFVSVSLLDIASGPFPRLFFSTFVIFLLFISIIFVILGETKLCSCFISNRTISLFLNLYFSLPISFYCLRNLEPFAEVIMNPRPHWTLFVAFFLKDNNESVHFSIFGSGRGHDVFSSYLKWNRNPWESLANFKMARLSGSDETKKKRHLIKG